MNKKLVLVFLAGWALALLIPPARVVGYFKGNKT
jgi:hypothetical protein